MPEIMGYELADIILLFFIYGFLGWCCEVAYAAVDTGKFVNRGFLNGPICPIYGVGVVSAEVLLTPFSDNLIVLYIGSFLLLSAIEFITGWIMEKLFGMRWWDYSDKKFNIKGYVCLEFSIIWGLAGTFIMKVIHPLVYGAVEWLPDPLVYVLVCVLLILIICDIAATVVAVRKLQKRIRAITGLAEDIHRMSDRIGDGISSVVLSTKQFADDTQGIYAEYKELCERHRAEEKALVDAHRAEEQELLAVSNLNAKAMMSSRKTTGEEKLEQKLEALRDNLNFKSRTQDRLLKAFPKARLNEGQEGFDRLVKSLNTRKKHRKKSGEKDEESNGEEQ